MIRYTVLFLISILFLSCDGESLSQIRFTEPIKGKTINLSNRVGNSFSILRSDDTIFYALSYDKATSYNYLVKSNVDTVFAGTITKRNELYLLNRMLENGEYNIHALKFTDSTVTGLETEWLQNILINEALREDKYTSLIVDTTKGKVLEVNKKQGKSIFRNVIDSLKPEYFAVNNTIKITDVVEVESEVVKAISKNKMIDKVYPNPFVNEVTVELLADKLYLFKVFDLNGKLIKNIEKKASKIKLDFDQLRV